MTEGKVKDIVGELMTGMYKRTDALSKRLGELEKRLDTPREHSIKQVGQIDKLQESLANLTDQLTQLAYAVNALEADVKELERAHNTKDTARLALQIIAADRGIRV